MLSLARQFLGSVFLFLFFFSLFSWLCDQNILHSTLKPTILFFLVRQAFHWIRSRNTMNIDKMVIFREKLQFPISVCHNTLATKIFTQEVKYSSQTSYSKEGYTIIYLTSSHEKRKEDDFFLIFGCIKDNRTCYGRDRPFLRWMSETKQLSSHTNVTREN